uniref:KAT8 regulatory NSL complex subunit 2 n=1 Tax=Phallusia mammillata TaxID=59560 RepID=A0A6F9DGQ5_9ASCI|nr:uncharacterized protein LOC100180613 [Phallusia mammillata]
MESKLTTTCCYSAHVCKRSRFKEYKYCLRHILEDQSAPFVKCQHISKITKRRCLTPALKPDRNSITNMVLCDHHRHMKAKNYKHKGKMRRNFLINDTTNYETKQKAAIHEVSVFLPKTRPLSETDSSDEDHAQSNEKWQVHQSSSWRAGEPDIDLQLLDENDSALLHADIFTPEEVVSLSRDNLVRLQAMYIDQFKHLHQELVANRLQYLSSEYMEPSGSQKDLQSLSNFRCCSGPEALLSKQKNEKRQSISNMDQTLARTDYHSAKSRCCHVSNHVRCKLSCLPYTKFCTMHILNDPLQVLYKPCFYIGCEEPVCLLNSSTIKPNVSVKKSNFCALHVHMSDMQEDLHTLTNELAKPLDLQDVCLVASEKECDISVVKEDSLSLDVDVVKVETNCDGKNIVSGHKLLTNSCPEYLITDNQSNENKPTLKSNIPLNIKGLPSVASSELPTRANTTACALDDLQPSQCYLLNSCIKKDDHSLHLQELTGINSSGNPKLGQYLVVKTNTEQTVKLGNLHSNDNQSVQLNLDPQTQPGVKPAVVEVTHKGSLLSVSHHVASSGVVYESKQTFIPPVEKKVCSQDNQLLDMPALAPVGGNTSICFKNESKVKNTVFEPTTRPMDQLSVSVKEKEIKPPFSNSDLDRKPTCPDEETAIASLLSLCTPTSLPKLDTMPN